MPRLRRAPVLCFLTAMALSINTRAFTQSATRPQDIARLAELGSVHETFKWFQSHEADFRKLQLAMVKIPAPPFGEGTRAQWVRDRFKEAGLQEIEIDKAGNVIGISHGTDRKLPLIALTAHIDTVFPADTSLQTKIEGNKMFGPGISDNGAGVMGLLAIASALKATPNLKHTAGILFVGNVGEEGEGDLRGMRFLFQESKWKDRIGTTIVLDGAGVDSIVTQALGSKRFEVIVRGPGGHSWSDFGTPNPIVVLSRAIAKFSESSVPSDPRTSFNVGVIQGGTSVNSIPESASARIDIRSASTQEIDALEKSLRDAVTNAVREVQDPKSKKGIVTSDIKIIGQRPAADLKPDAHVYSVIRAVDAHLDLRAQTRRASTDANVPLSLGREAISIGAGGTGGGAHTIQEWYDASGRDLGLKRVMLAVLALTGVNE
ncbi:MAG: peptidase [Acidobacteriales bacterium]|nr:peptidase [Terriglobales bacterium]